MKYAWIDQQRANYPISMRCELLEVSRSGFNASRARKPSEREQSDAGLVDVIRRRQRVHRGSYGRRRMSIELSELFAQPINHKRVARLMHKHGLQSHKRRRFRVVTTDSKHAHPVAPNVLNRNFSATAPNQKWLTDLTYVPTDEGWLYAAFVLDLFARKLVGFAMSATMTQDLTLVALEMALGLRDPQPGELLHHSDRGSQYAAGAYRELLRARGIAVSMSRKGDCWDNAPMEAFNGTLKVECVQGERFVTRAQARQAI